jgi:3'-5' exoribonuclease
MPTDDRLVLRDLAVGAAVVGTACVRRLTRSVTKDGKPYLTVEVGNATGAAGGKVWSEQLEAWANITAGQPVQITARVKPGHRDGPPELAFEAVSPLAKDHPVALEINPLAPVPLATLRERYTHLTAHLTPPGQVLLDVVLDHVGRDAWWTAPAAKGHHHAFVHGLAMHSIEVAEIALAAAQASPAAEHLDYDALLVGALGHDCGKKNEYVWQNEPIGMNRDGFLSYHTVEGCSMVAVAAALGRDRLAAAGVHPLAVEHLKHVIASHHGQKDWGSPVEPRSLEAVLIHVADLASARTRSMLDELEDALQPDGWAIASGYNRKPVFSLRTALARADRCPKAPPCDDAAPEAAMKVSDRASDALPRRIVAYLMVRPEAGFTLT